MHNRLAESGQRRQTFNAGDVLERKKDRSSGSVERRVLRVYVVEGSQGLFQVSGQSRRVLVISPWLYSTVLYLEGGIRM